MKIAVTGASGFIGRQVISLLAETDVETVAISRHTSRIRDIPGVRLEEMDVGHADRGLYERLGRPDTLIHLAWGGLPNYKSLHHFECETPKHYAFLKTMIEGGLSSLIAVGTCFEYGMQSGPLSEELPALPNNPYGYAKDALRRQLEFLRTTIPFNFTWARLFYLYGAGQPETALFSQVKRAASKGDKVFNMSGGEQLRDYLDVETVAKYIAHMAFMGADAGVINVCSGQPISVRSLVESWLKEYDWKLTLNLGHYPYPDYEPMAFWGDRRRLDALWKPA